LLRRRQDDEKGLTMKPRERIEQLARSYADRCNKTLDSIMPADSVRGLFTPAHASELACQLEAIIAYLDEQHEDADVEERKRIQRAMPETFGSMGRDERATQKLRRLHDELRSWKLDYEQRISSLDPVANTRDFEITYKAFVVGIERLMEIIEQ